MAKREGKLKNTSTLNLVPSTVRGRQGTAEDTRRCLPSFFNFIFIFLPRSLEMTSAWTIGPNNTLTVSCLTEYRFGLLHMIFKKKKKKTYFITRYFEVLYTSHTFLHRHEYIRLFQYYQSIPLILVLHRTFYVFDECCCCECFLFYYVIRIYNLGIPLVIFSAKI